MKKLFTLVIFISLFTSNKIFAQASYLGLDGGFEGSATIDNVNTGAAPVAGKWTKANANITITAETGTVRSGSNSIKVNATSTSTSRMFSPSFTVAASTTKWVIQCYRRATSTTATVQFQLGNWRGATEALSGSYAAVTAANTWEKVTYAPTSVTSVTTAAADIIAKMATSAGDVYLDDFAMYESSTGVDVTAANAPTAPGISNATGSSLDVSWTAASGGVDGGGYMVVRGTSDPTTTPNANGIYAVGNTTAAGENVVYVGTGLTFTDVGLAASTTYYYRIYTFDKAYNYSTAATTNGVTSGVCLAPTTAATSITFASTTINSTTVNWTNGNGSKRIVVARLGSAVTWTPTDNTTYAANASFGSGTDVSGSGEYVVYNNNSNTVPVTNLAATSTYYFKVYEYNCSAGSEKYFLTSPPSNSVLTPASIAAPTFTTPICVSYGGATLLVSFTSTGTFTGNTYTVEMSDGAGSFASYTTIGTFVTNNNTNTNLSCTIPYGTVGGALGNNYLLRVRASSPSTLGATSTALAVNTIAISPLTTQNFSPGAGGGASPLTAAGTTGTPTKSWAYATVSGGPYTALGSAGNPYTPVLASCGTFYVVCQVTSYSCGTTTSAEVQCNVSMPAVTSPTVTNACIDVETVNWILPGGYSSSNNTILVFAKAGSAVTAGTPTNAIGTYTANTTFGSGTPYQNDASAFCVYSGTSNTVNVSGLTANTTYHYLILNVQNSPTVYATGATTNGTTLVSVPNVTGLTVTPANGELIIGWTMGSCYDDVLVVVTDNLSVTTTPTLDGTQYVDYSVYGDPTSNVNLPSNEYDVYQGTGTTVTVSGLVNLTTYNIKIFTRKGTTWSSGTVGSGVPTTTPGDFQTVTSGNWTDYTIWERYSGGVWVPAVSGEYPNLGYAATIKTGHTVTLNGSGPYSVSTLTVQSGGKLFTNQNATNIYISIFSQIVCNGTIGNYPTDDGIGFNIEGANCTLTGTGSFACSRIKKDFSANSSSTFIMSMNANLTWPATVLYNNQAGTIFNVTINTGATVSTKATMGNISMDGTSGNGSGDMKGALTVKGTLNVNGKYYMTTDNGVGSGTALLIATGGVVNVDSIDAADGSSVGHTLLIQTGGRLNIYGQDAFYLFGNSKNIYTLNSGSTVEYSGTTNQPVESGINYHHLKYSGSGNKIANGNLTVNGNFTVDAAVCEFNTPVKTLNIRGNLTLQNGGTMSDNCKTYLNITTNNATTAQTFTGNSQLIKCLNLTSVKTAGNLIFAGTAGNSDCYIKNDLLIDHSGSAVMTDNGNTLSVGDDAQIGSTSSTNSNFNLTGTLKFIGISGATDIHLSDYGGTGVTKAHIGNLMVEPVSGAPISTIQFYPTGGTQTVYIDGNINILNTNGTGTVLDPDNNTISLKGNWSNYNISGFNEGSGKVILGGTATQTISNAETFYQLELNNGNGASLTSNAIVANELILTNGVLATGSNEIQVTNNASGAVTGFSVSSWVNGNLRRSVGSSGNYDFPVGDAANYQLASVNLNSQTGMSDILAFFNTTITGAAPGYPTTEINGDGIYGILNSGFWTITPNGYSAVNYDITLNQRGYSNFSGNANQIGVIKRPDASSNWLGTTLANSYGHHDNATQSISSGTAVAVRTGVSAFSDFAEGFGGLPLPVTLSSFTLSVKENKLVALNWKTESEINCDYYIVERSVDGLNFESIGTVAGHKTSDQPHTYQLIDSKPLCTESYYRLHQVDINAEEHFSNKISAVISCNEISIYPNPVSDNLTFEFSSTLSKPIKLTIKNAEGKLMVERMIQLTTEDFNLNVSALPAGLYFIQFTNESLNFNHSFLKQ